ncbi:MAG: RNA polymerase sigma factor [Planctomycetota bacterium]
MSEDLQRLVARASAGDSAAVEELLLRHLPALRAFLRLKAGPAILQHESSSDLAQSVCRDILEGADRFQFGGEPEFRKWLFTTAMRKIADRHEHWQAQKRRAAAVQGGLDEDLSALAAIWSPSQQAMAREELEAVERSFSRLSPDKQEVILMHRLMGMSHAQIAAELGKTEVAVRSMLSRALAELGAGL